MTDIEMRAHLLTIEFLRLKASGNQISTMASAEAYAKEYKRNYQLILLELRNKQ